MKLQAKLVENKKISKIVKLNSVVDHVKNIMEKIRDIDIHKLKLDPEFILYVCEIIENQIRDYKGCGKDKKAIFLAVMRELQVDQDQLVMIEQTLEFLLQNKLIKKTKFKKIIWHCVKRVFLGQASQPVSPKH